MSGCEKKQKKKRNEIGSRHPLRFTRRTSRGALCSREVPARCGAARRGAAINFATVLDGTLRTIFARADFLSATPSSKIHIFFRE